MSNKQLKATLDREFQESPTANLAQILAQLQYQQRVETLTIDVDLVETLGRSGVTVKNACSLLHKSFDYFDRNPDMRAAFDRGRADLGTRVRTRLIEAALDHGNIQSAIHLDRIYSGDTVSEVNVTVRAPELTAVSDADLLRVAFTVPDGAAVDNTIITPVAGSVKPQ